MQGIEILSQADVAIGRSFSWLAFWITFGIIMLPVLIGSIIIALDDDEWLVSFALPLMCAVFVAPIGLLIGNAAGNPNKYETQYKVTISEEVSMIEFYKHYEIIDQDGRIFTVREKTNE